MKFNKTIAHAFAQRANEQLNAKREEELKNFTLPTATSKRLKKLFQDYLTYQKKMQNAYSILRSETNIGIYNDETPDEFIKRYTRNLATKAIPAAPTIPTLEVDFLIESVGVDDAEALIAKVMSKYSN